MNLQTDLEYHLESIIERDIDLLVLEEFLSNPGFQQLFLKAVNVQQPMTCIGAWHSVSLENDGQSDLLVLYEASGLKHLYLIENKIDANFTYEQPERYHVRAQKYISLGAAGSASVVLMAPEQYTVRSDHFDHYVTYEQMIEWFSVIDGENKSRMGHKIELLQTAIHKLRRGYKLRENAAVTGFWPSYYQLVRMEFPDLYMKYKPSDRPVKSRTFSFYITGRHFAKADYMAHQAAEGTVNFYAFGRGYDESYFKETYSPLLPDGVEIGRSGKSAVIYIHTPPFLVTDPFELQLPAIRAGLSRLQQLKNWLQANYFG